MVAFTMRRDREGTPVQRDVLSVIQRESHLLNEHIRVCNVGNPFPGNQILLDIKELTPNCIPSTVLSAGNLAETKLTLSNI